MYIISAIGLRGLFSSLTPMERHVHPALATAGLDFDKIDDYCEDSHLCGHYIYHEPRNLRLSL
jgi:hypothetical protein